MVSPQVGQSRPARNALMGLLSKTCGMMTTLLSPNSKPMAKVVGAAVIGALAKSGPLVRKAVLAHSPRVSQPPPPTDTPRPSSPAPSNSDTLVPPTLSSRFTPAPDVTSPSTLAAVPTLLPPPSPAPLTPPSSLGVPSDSARLDEINRNVAGLDSLLRLASPLPAQTAVGNASVLHRVGWSLTSSVAASAALAALGRYLDVPIELHVISSAASPFFRSFVRAVSSILLPLPGLSPLLTAALDWFGSTATASLTARSFGLLASALLRRILTVSVDWLLPFIPLPDFGRLVSTALTPLACSIRPPGMDVLAADPILSRYEAPIAILRTAFTPAATGPEWAPLDLLSDSPDTQLAKYLRHVSDVTDALNFLKGQLVDSTQGQSHPGAVAYRKRLSTLRACILKHEEAIDRFQRRLSRILWLLRLPQSFREAATRHSLIIRTFGEVSCDLLWTILSLERGDPSLRAILAGNSPGALMEYLARYPRGILPL
jgi:hypothetical protein